MTNNEDFEPINTMYLSIDYITNLFNEGKEIDYKNIGLMLNLKVELSIFMYKVFLPKKGRSKTLVKVNSYDLSRKLIVDHLIEFAIKNHQLGKSLGYTSMYIQNIKNFVVWANSYSFDFLSTIYDARKIYIEYVRFLMMSIRNGSFTNNHAYFNQIYVSNFLTKIHNDTKSYITAGISKIKKVKLNNNEVSDEDDKKYVFNFYTKLFDQIYIFLIKNKSYPLKLDLPNNNSFWVLPSCNQFNNKMVKNNDFFCQNKERYLEFDEINKIKKSIKDYSVHKKNLEEANQYFSAERIYLATKAINAYYMHFLNITGMNDSVIGTLFWNNDYHIQKNKQKFSNIKYRANNKPVEFQIQNIFISRFHDFLKLREYALHGKECEYLFFNILNNKVNISKNQLNGKQSSQINHFMKKSIDNNLPIINSRQFRINKGNYVANEDGLIVASQVLQNSIGVIKNNYLTENSDLSSIQFTNYFNKLNKNIFADKNDTLVDTSIGQCRSIDNPVSEIQHNIFKSACKQAEGCLFCEKYACHPDEVDLKKLYSLLFLIQEASVNAKSIEHFDRVYGDVINRINSIIDEMIQKYNILEMATKIKTEVFEYENLHPYWERKLKILYEIGVI